MHVNDWLQDIGQWKNTEKDEIACQFWGALVLA